MAGEDTLIGLIRSLAYNAAITRDTTSSYWHNWKYRCPCCPKEYCSRESIYHHLYRHSQEQLRDAWIAKTLATS